jgi:hypothetical protein
LLPILSLFLGWYFKSPRGKGRWKRDEKGCLRFWRGWMLVNKGGERREEVKELILFTVGPWVEVGRHRSDRWRASVRLVTALGRVSEPLVVFPTRPR